jgi:hypothetical protein
MLSTFAQLSPAQSGTPSVPEANPGRPTVSTPATLTPVGYLQFENGVLFAEHSTEFSKRAGIGQVTKLSVLPRLELFLQSEPLAISQSKERTAVHEGEVFAGVQSVLFVGDESRPTVSISYVRRVHTSAAPELDVGTFRQSTSILMSEDPHGFHFDTNGILAEQPGRCTSSAVRTNAIYFPSSGEVHDFGRGMAFLTAVRKGQDRR